MARREPRWLKVHYLYECRYFEEYGGDTTNDLTKVTCKRCLGKIKKYNLQHRSNFAETPIFTVHVVEDFGHRAVIGLRCPVCGRMNTHNRDDTPGDGNGHRCAPCSCWENGYYIREIESVEGVEGTSEIPDAPEKLNMIAVRSKVIDHIKCVAKILGKSPGDLLENTFSEWNQRQESFSDGSIIMTIKVPQHIERLLTQVAAKRDDKTVGDFIEHLVQQQTATLLEKELKELEAAEV